MREARERVQKPKTTANVTVTVENGQEKYHLTVSSVKEYEPPHLWRFDGEKTNVLRVRSRRSLTQKVSAVLVCSFETGKGRLLLRE